MNIYDSDRMKDVLAPLGYGAVDEADDVDMVIVNTCHIREKAAEKLFSELGRYRQMKEARRENGQSTIIAVAGCVAQATGAEIINRAPFVDIVLGPQTYHRLPEMIARATRAGERNSPECSCENPGAGIMDIEFPEEPKFDHLPNITAKGFSAFQSVQEGCDKFCTFCVVPYTRGSEFSRSVRDVLAEAENLAAHGVREITLLGQNVNAYHGAPVTGDQEVGLGRLIRQVAEIDGIERIRYTTSHPVDMDEELISAHGDVAQLMPFLHLPVQSGSDRMLSAMNRNHSIDDFRRLHDRLMTAQPKLKLSSDFIVGFPGESDADFEATMDLAREIGFIQAYSFKYSPRPGTPGATMSNCVPDEIMSERLSRLQDLLTSNQAGFNQSCLGESFTVLLDRKGRKEGQLAGRSPFMQPVHLQASAEYFGRIVQVRITDAFANSLTGSLDGEPASHDSQVSEQRISA